jgi:DNA-binding response OmpR family regulator
MVALHAVKELVTTTPSRRPTLLIVDDSPTALVFLEAIFKGANYDVETAATGNEGIEKALRLVPDLVITDGIMPDVDGFDLIKRMREHEPTAQVPVIMLTSGDFRDAEYADRVPQPDAYIAKSMELDPLLKQVKKMIKI